MPGTNWVPRVTSPIDRTHPARAYGRFNAIGSEGRTGREFHVRLEYSGRGGYRQSEQAIRVLGTSNSLQTPLKPCIWLEHIAARTSFAFETTLRHDFALSVVREAKAVGFTTDLYLVVLDSVERHVQRVTARARAGGHSAPVSLLRDIYTRSIAHLPLALATFNHVKVVDNTHELTPPVTCAQGRITARHPAIELPDWLKFALGEESAE